MATQTNNGVGAAAKIFLVIAIIGAVNWGLIGFFNFNLVDAIFGGGSAEQTSGTSRVIYALVGIAGVIGLVMLPKLRALTDRGYAERPIGG